MTEKKSSQKAQAKKAPRKKQKSTRQMLAELRKSVKELTARVAVLEGDTTGQSVEQATISKTQQQGYGDATLREKTNLEMTDFDKVRSVINATALLPYNMRDEKGFHTLENISSICGFAVTKEQRLAAYSDPKFRQHLEEFGLMTPEIKALVKEEKAA